MWLSAAEIHHISNISALKIPLLTLLIYIDFNTSEAATGGVL